MVVRSRSETLQEMWENPRLSPVEVGGEVGDLSEGVSNSPKADASNLIGSGRERYGLSLFYVGNMECTDRGILCSVWEFGMNGRNSELSPKRCIELY